MSEVDDYIRAVARNVVARPRQRARIEADLRSHFSEAEAQGEPVTAVIERLGQPIEVAAELIARDALPYAGFWRRLGALTVDVMICFGLVGVLAGFAILTANLVPQGTQTFPPSLTGFRYALAALLVLVTISLALAAAGAALLYFPLQEGRFGRTIGKRVLGLWVVKEDGTPIGMGEALLRRLPFYFRFEPLDALFVIFTAKRQRAFDIIARTVVIKESK